MIRITLLALVSTSLLTFAPARADDAVNLGWSDNNAAYGQTASSGSQGSQNAATPGNQYGQAMQTANQTNWNTFATPGGAQTTSGYIIPGTHIAPGNLAFMVEHGTPIGGSLPVTNLDSFVFQSGMNPMVYGDEGTDGPPPFDSFETIGGSRDLPTTGHSRWNAPSSWY